MKKIIRLTESDLTRIVKRVIKETAESEMDLESTSDWPRWLKRKRPGSDFLIDKNPVDITKTVNASRFNRKLYFDDGTEATRAYDSIKYGYDAGNEKIIQGIAPSKGGASDYANNVFYYCDTQKLMLPSNGWVGTVTTQNFDRSKQEQSDKQWLIKWCDKIPKRSLVKQDKRVLSMNPYKV